jgi:hypothetical protein
MNDVFKQLNWAFLLSHKIYGGPPPAGCRRAWCSLLSISFKQHNEISNILQNKMDSVLIAMRDSNGNNDLTTFNSLQDFIKAVMVWSGNQIPEDDANIMIAAAQDLIQPLRKPEAKQAV